MIKTLLRHVAIALVALASVPVLFSVIRAWTYPAPDLFQIDATTDRIQFIASEFETSTIRVENVRVLIGGVPFAPNMPGKTTCVTGFVTPYMGSRVALSIQNGAQIATVSPPLGARSGSAFAEVELETKKGEEIPEGRAWSVTPSLLSSEGMSGWIVSLKGDAEFVAADDCASEATAETGEDAGNREQQNREATTDGPAFASPSYPIHISGYGQIGLHTPHSSDGQEATDPLPAVSYRGGVQISGSVQVFTSSLLCLSRDSCTYFPSPNREFVIPAVSGLAPFLQDRAEPKNSSIGQGADGSLGDAGTFPPLRGTVLFSDGLYHVHASTQADYLVVNIPPIRRGGETAGSLGLSPLEGLLSDPHVATVISLTLALLGLVGSLYGLLPDPPGRKEEDLS